MNPWLAPVRLAMLAAGVTPLADAMSPADDTPRYLDSGQFAAFGIGLALVVALLCVVAVGVWRK